MQERPGTRSPTAQDYASAIGAMEAAKRRIREALAALEQIASNPAIAAEGDPSCLVDQHSNLVDVLAWLRAESGLLRDPVA